MSLNYKTIYECCLEKANELNIQFDFENNPDLQNPQNIDELYKNFVYHSQNRSQGYALNFFEVKKETADSIWKIISSYKFNLKNNFDYLNLFQEIIKDKNVSTALSPNKGKDIQYLELAKTCQCIYEYLSKYRNLNDFVKNHKFDADFKNNWKIIKIVENEIYNMGPALISDFFKEQKCIKGREYLIKADVHVKRFFKNICDTNNMNDKKLYDLMLYLYKNTDNMTKKEAPPYKLDKLIYLIGIKMDDPIKEEKFAKSVAKR